MGQQKDKLEAGLEDLFSTPKRNAPRSNPAPLADFEDVERSKSPDPSSLGSEKRLPTAPDRAAAPEDGNQEEKMAIVPADNTPSPPRQHTNETVENGQNEQLVIFHLAGDDYGLSVMQVERIIKPPPTTVVPRTPLFIEGLTNLRGTALPVIDLRRRLGLPEAETTGKTRIIVVEINEIKVGLRVDTVIEVLHIPTEEIEPPSPIVKTVASDFIRGIAKVADGQAVRLIILLDLAYVLVTKTWATAVAPPAASATGLK